MLCIFLAGGALTPLPSDLTLNTAAAQKTSQRNVLSDNKNATYFLENFHFPNLQVAASDSFTTSPGVAWHARSMVCAFKLNFDVLLFFFSVFLKATGGEFYPQ